MDNELVFDKLTENINLDGHKRNFQEFLSIYISEKLGIVRKIDKLTLIQAGINVINQLTESNIVFSIDTLYNQKIISFHIKTEKFEFYRKRGIEHN